MSTRSFLLAAMLAGLLLAGGGHAAESTSKNVPVVIGIVDVQAVLRDSEPALAAKKQMEDKYGKDRSELQKLGDSLKKRAEELKNPKSATEAKQRAFGRARDEYNQKTQTLLRKVEQDEIKLRQDMIKLVFDAAYNVAQAKQLTYVVDVTAGGVIYADRSMELTQDVLDEVNKLYKEKGVKQDAKEQQGSEKKDEKK